MKNLLLFALLALICAYVAAAEEPRTIKIGAVASLTGDAAMNAEEWVRGARMASEESVGTGNRVELVVEDDGTIPTRAVAAFNKLVSIDKVQGVVGGTWDFLAETLYPLAERAKIPFVTPTNPIEVISLAAKQNKWIFTNGLSLTAAVSAADKYLAKSNVRRVGLAVINVPYGLEHARLLRESLQHRGVEIAFDERLTYEGLRDEIKALALKVRRTSPDAIFLVLNYSAVDTFLLETSKLKVAPLTLMTHTLLEAASFGEFASRYERARGIYQDMRDPEFDKRFRRRWSLAPTGYAASGYDAVMCLSQALAARVFPLQDDREFICSGVTGSHIFSVKRRDLVQNSALVMRTRRQELVVDE